MLGLSPAVTISICSSPQITPLLFGGDRGTKHHVLTWGHGLCVGVAFEGLEVYGSAHSLIHSCNLSLTHSLTVLPHRDGQLGHGGRANQPQPTRVPCFSAPSRQVTRINKNSGSMLVTLCTATLVQVTAVSLGISHSAALTAEGGLYSWGFGGDGRCV